MAITPIPTKPVLPQAPLSQDKGVQKYTMDLNRMLFNILAEIARRANASTWIDPGDDQTAGKLVEFTGVANKVAASAVVIGDLATKVYVDAQDAATLAAANAYTDAREIVIKSYADAGDAATLASANAYTDAREVVIKSYADAGDAATLTSAEAYADSLITAGMVVDSAVAAYSTTSSLTAVIPIDNTIPQISEGTQILTLNITPKSATNKLRIRVSGGWYNRAAAVNNVAAIFADNDVNAKAAILDSIEVAGYLGQVAFETEFVPGSTATRTISVRVGPTAGTCVVNGAYLGGTNRWWLTVEEIKA